MKKYTASEARNNLGEIINRAYYTSQPVIVERRNKPLVAIVPLTPPGHTTESAPWGLPIYHLGGTKGTLSRSEIYGKEGR
ncbi:MAG: type II toxin-antitoxin system Phd/YefM family antitoxin [Deltaproteobacteria bacterium]|nr:type II toxin-antitoxin system Phd/YefM family antitoxin [Deltaproteobacteria bacterium]